MDDDGEPDEDWGETLDVNGPEYWEDYLGGPDDDYLESEAKARFEEYKSEISAEDVDSASASCAGCRSPAPAAGKKSKASARENPPKDMIPIECYYDEFKITDNKIANSFTTPRACSKEKKTIASNAKKQNLELGEMQEALLRYAEEDEWEFNENEVDEDEYRKQVLAQVTGCSVSEIFVDNDPLKDIFTISTEDNEIGYIIKEVELVRDYQREDLAERKAEARLRIELLEKPFEDYINYYRQEFTRWFRLRIPFDESDWTIRQYVIAEALNSPKFYREMNDSLREKRELQLVAARIALQEYATVDELLDATVVMKPASKYLEDGELVACDSGYFIFKLNSRR